MGQGQRSRPNLWGSAFPSATKNKESLSVQGVCLCVDLSCGCGRSAFNALLSGSFINWVTLHKMGQGFTLKFSHLFRPFIKMQVSTLHFLQVMCLY